MREAFFESDHAVTEYIEEDNAVLHTWKKEAHYDDYREPVMASLKLLREHRDSIFIVDARNGFEDVREDVDWGFDYFLPELRKTGCRIWGFILPEISGIEGEIDLWTREIEKNFCVIRAVSYGDIIDRAKAFTLTPIKDFTDKYAGSGIIRAHMPGHKGRVDAFNALDITEIKGADSLFEAEGIIAESEKRASQIFGSAKTLYSAGGSTLCIFTMLAMCLMGRDNRKVVAVRNCHRAFLNACVMLDADIEWVYPEYRSSVVSGRVTARMIEEAVIRAGEPVCVYLTSPDYLGRITSLDEISDVCRKYGCLLLVDNAHGAYLRFVKGDDGRPLHPLYHGADMCCDSAHKTLPVLTGGAYLHIADSSTEKYDGYAKELMSMFGSSSPSYLILRSLDMCNAFMEKDAQDYFDRMRAASERLKEELAPFWHIEETGCGKLTVYAPAEGLTGHDLADALRDNGIECEYADHTHIVLMLTGLTEAEIASVGEAFSHIRQPRMTVCVPDLSGLAPLEKAMSIREAAMAACECVPIDEAVGRICARAVSCCPPGVAAAAGGEIFSAEIINILKNYSFLRVNVVK